MLDDLKERLTEALRKQDLAAAFLASRALHARAALDAKVAGNVEVAGNAKVYGRGRQIRKELT